MLTIGAASGARSADLELCCPIPADDLQDLLRWGTVAETKDASYLGPLAGAAVGDPAFMGKNVGVDS